MLLPSSGFQLRLRASVSLPFQHLQGMSECMSGDHAILRPHFASGYWEESPPTQQRMLLIVVCVNGSFLADAVNRCEGRRVSPWSSHALCWSIQESKNAVAFGKLGRALIRAWLPMAVLSAADLGLLKNSRDIALPYQTDVRHV